MLDLGGREAEALSLAGLMAAGALGAVAFSLAPGIFRPWPVAFLVFFLAGMAGALCFWAVDGRISGLPLVVLFLPPLRLFLFWLRGRSLPWPIDYRLFLCGEDFPWWAGASLLSSLYAGKLAVSWTQVSLALVRWREKRLPERSETVAKACHAAEEARRVFMGTLLLGGFGLALLGKKRGDGFPATFCLLVFLLGGAFFLGLIQARSLVASWQAEGVEVEAGCEERWWRGQRLWLWLAFLFLFFLPGSARALRLPEILAFFASFFPFGRMAQRRFWPVSPFGPGTPLPQAPGALRTLLLALLFFFYLFSVLLAFIVMGGLFLFALRGLARALGRFFSALVPFLRAVYRFFRACLRVFRQVVVARFPGGGARFGRFSSRHKKAARPGRLFPPSMVRRLFAKLVLWGRSQGLILPATLAPAEFVRRLLTLVPEREEDLAYLAEVYRQERYGGEIPDRRARVLYRKAWQRVVRESTKKAKGPGSP
ncbi:MAG: DUF4129 domain-containing protein [Bacillota bacterium]